MTMGSAVGIFAATSLGHHMDSSLAFIHQIGIPGLVAILIIALIIFGKRLPDVARSLGKGIVEFKKGVRGIEDEVDDNVYKQENSQPSQPASTHRSEQPAGSSSYTTKD